jgi:hypothetical protein
VKCRRCGAEIAAKAIVCYRCGTPTAVDTAPNVVLPSSRVRWGALASAIAVVAAAAVLGMLWPAYQRVIWAAGVVVAAVVAVAVVGRRRGR